MISITYNISQKLKERLGTIDALRQEILLASVSPQIEATLRWQAVIGHLEGWASLSNQPLTHDHILDIVSRLQAKNATPLAEKVLRYKNALNFIQEEWRGNTSPVTFDTIKRISDVLGVNHGSKEEIEALLTYLQSGQLHPVIQAAIAHLSFYPSRLAYIVAHLFLARAGYDLRGWLSLEDCWNQNKPAFLQVLQPEKNTVSSTEWLEFFCQGLIVQMNAIKSDIQTQQTTPVQSVSKDLNQRQKDIIEMMIKNNSPITNRDVQKAFGVSQITASRDLAKLSIAGLIAPHGGGRSTYYSKI